MSVRELLDTLAGIQETVLLYQGERGRPRARRMLTEIDPTQRRLYDLFGLAAYAPDTAMTTTAALPAAWAALEAALPPTPPGPRLLPRPTNGSSAPTPSAGRTTGPCCSATRPAGTPAPEHSPPIPANGGGACSSTRSTTSSPPSRPAHGQTADNYNPSHPFNARGHMDIGLSEDQLLFQETCRRALEQRSPVTRVRELIDDPVGFDPGVWAQGGELGWYAMLVPENATAGAACPARVSSISPSSPRNWAESIHPGPFQATNIVAFALAEFGFARSARAVPPDDRIRREHRHLGVRRAGPRLVRLGDRPSTATPAGAGFVLDGVKSYVHDAQAADVLLVTALAPGGLTQFLLATDTAGVTVEPLECLDLARRLAEVRFRPVEVPRRRWSASPGAPRRPSSGSCRWRWSCSARRRPAPPITGLAMTVQYAKDRVAFGRPIGSYQA